MPDARIFAEVAQYGELLAAMRSRLGELGITPEVADDLAGQAPRYLSKILAPMQLKRLTVHSLLSYAGALGLRLALIVDEAQLARMRAHANFRLRKKPHPHSDVVVIRLSRRHMVKIGRKGGRNSRINLTPAKRRKLSRLANAARWPRKEV